MEDKYKTFSAVANCEVEGRDYVIGDSEHDGLLEAREIMNMKLNVGSAVRLRNRKRQNKPWRRRDGNIVGVLRCWNTLDVSKPMERKLR